MNHRTVVLDEPRRPEECSACGFDAGAYLRLLGERDALRAENAELRAALAARDGKTSIRTLSPPTFGERPLGFDRMTIDAAAVRAEAPSSSARWSGAVARERAPSSARDPRAEPEDPPPMVGSFDEVPRAAFDPFGPANGTVARREQGIDFGAVSRLGPEELDRLPYGLITLDSTGRIVHYNDTESRMVGLPKERVLGKSFFGHVAPCTRVREFQGRFEELVREPHRVRVQAFDFVFKFATGDQQVSIVITPAKTRGLFHVAILRR